MPMPEIPSHFRLKYTCTYTCIFVLVVSMTGMYINTRHDCDMQTDQESIDVGCRQTDSGGCGERGGEIERLPTSVTQHAPGYGLHVPG